MTLALTVGSQEDSKLKARLGYRVKLSQIENKNLNQDLSETTPSR